MVAPAAQLPELTQDELILLTQYVENNFNLIALSRQADYNIFGLTAWLLQPHIQANLNAYREMLKLQYEAEQAAARSAGITHLIDIVNTTQDAKERRRAATLLVRVGALKPLPEGGVGVGSQRPHDNQPTDARAKTSPAHEPIDAGHPREPAFSQPERLESSSRGQSESSSAAPGSPHANHSTPKGCDQPSPDEAAGSQELHNHRTSHTISSPTNVPEQVSATHSHPHSSDEHAKPTPDISTTPGPASG